MNTAELIVKLRAVAHGLEMGYFVSDPEIIKLLDQAADALKIAWETQYKLALKKELSEEQKKEMFNIFDREADII